MTPRMTGQVVILSSVDWSATWQRHHAFAAAFSAQGAEVFFVENTGFRDFQFSDVSRIKGRLVRHLSRSRARPPGRPKGVRVIAPLVLPPTNAAFRAANAVYFLPLLAQRLRSRGLRSGATLFAYLPTDTTLALLGLLAPSCVIYDCVDNFSGHPTPPEDLAKTEGALLACSDAVLTTSRFLFTEKSRAHPHVHLVHHGTSEAFFGRPRERGPIKSFCYFGTIWSAVDFEAVAALARAGYSVTLAGPVKDPPPPLPDGVVMAPAMPHDRLPAFLEPFDALLLPYAATAYNKGVVPAKLWECLATGKPVVSSALHSLREHADLLYLADDARAFPAAAARAAAEDDHASSARRIAQARTCTTARQAAIVAGIVAEAKRRPAVHGFIPRSGGEAFLRGFSWISALFAAARLSTFAVQFVGARFLGPAVYGTAHLVGAVASVAQVVPMLGFPLALSHFTAAAADDRARGRMLVTGLTLFAAWVSACALAAAFFAPKLGPALDLPQAGVFLAACLALATAVHHVSSSSLQGLGRFRERGAVEVLYGMVSLGALTLLLAAGGRSYKVLIACYIVGLAAAAAASISLLFRRLRGRFDSEAMRRLAPYAAVGTVHVLAAALIQAPGRIITYHLHGPMETGLYSAYFAATIQVALAVSNILQTVILPLASRADLRLQTISAMRRTIPWATIGGWLSFSAVSLAALKVLGRDYPIRADWILLFGAAASLVCVHGAAAALFFARGYTGLRIAAIGALISGLGNLLFNLAFTPRLGTGGAALSLLMGYGLGLAWFIRRMHAPEEA